jgi:hypothetical protein
MKIDSQFGREGLAPAGQGRLPYQGPDPASHTKLLSTRQEPLHGHTHRPRTANLFSGTHKECAWCHNHTNRARSGPEPEAVEHDG